MELCIRYFWNIRAVPEGFNHYIGPFYSLNQNQSETETAPMWSSHVYLWPKRWQFLLVFSRNWCITLLLKENIDGVVMSQRWHNTLYSDMNRLHIHTIFSLVIIWHGYDDYHIPSYLLSNPLLVESKYSTGFIFFVESASSIEVLWSLTGLFVHPLLLTFFSFSATDIKKLKSSTKESFCTFSTG